MNQYRFTGPALLRLQAIYNHVALDNVEAAGSLIERILDACTVLASSPSIGKMRPELIGEVSLFPVKNYIILYRPVESGIEVVHVSHGAREIPPDFLA